MTKPKRAKPRFVAERVLSLIKKKPRDSVSKLAREVIEELHYERLVSESSVVRAFHRLKHKDLSPRGSVWHKGRCLSKEENDALLGAVLAFSKRNMGLSLREIRTLAETAFGRSFHHNFGHRFLDWNNHALAYRTVKPTTAQRRAKDPKDVDPFIEALKRAFDEEKYNAEDVWNVDETVMGNAVRQLDAKVVEAKEKHISTITGSKGWTSGSVVPFVNANGDVAFVVYVVKGDYSTKVDPTNVVVYLSDMSVGARGAPDRLFFASPSGRVDAFIFKEMMQHFAAYLSRLKRGKAQLVIMDNMSSHRVESVVSQAENQLMRIFYLWKYTTHVYQPLDLTVFGPFKSFLSQKRARLKFLKSIDNNVITGLMLKNAVLSMEDALKKQNVVSGFRTAGLFPLNVAIIRARCEGQWGLRVTTEIGREAELVFTATTQLLQDELLDGSDVRAVSVPEAQLFSGAQLVELYRTTGKPTRGPVKSSVQKRAEKKKLEQTKKIFGLLRKDVASRLKVMQSERTVSKDTLFRARRCAGCDNVDGKSWASNFAGWYFCPLGCMFLCPQCSGNGMMVHSLEIHVRHHNKDGKMEFSPLPAPRFEFSKHSDAADESQKK